MPLKEYNLSIDISSVLKNIVNKDNQYTIPIFIPHLGCNNECVFCNQRKITGISTSVTVNDVDNIITEHLKYFKNNKDNKKIEIAFFGGSFTGIPAKLQISYLKVANKYIKEGKVDSIRLSTRPDYISPKILSILKKYNVKTIELGVQSMSDEVLELSKRGHNKIDVIRASRLIHLYGIDLGIQIMVGLPGSTLDTELYSIKKVLNLNPKCLRIYPVYVLKDSKLYEMYENKEYVPLSIDDAIIRVYHILKECQKTNVKVIRIGLQTTSEITSSNTEIIGPVCDNFAEYVLSKIVLEEIEKYILKNNIKKENNLKQIINIYTKNKYTSVVVGPKKINKKYLKEKYDVDIKIKGENCEEGNFCM